MAIPDRCSADALLFAGNGANRPLHQDRQVLRAGDLALEQTTRDAMLARMRRYLHGWGVVAGLLPEVKSEKLLTIGPGYGVTPLGDELFLPAPVSLPEVAEAVVRCCGGGPVGCEVIDPEALAEARADDADIFITAWLIARPASREAAPRPGVPEGCEHPASSLLPSRRCGGVEFAILCELPPSHQPKAPECSALMPFVCGLPDEAPSPLPWEAVPGPEANFLVIARLTVTGRSLAAAVDARRILWPVSLVQDWIFSCLCSLLQRTQPEPPEPPRPVPPDPEPPRPVPPIPEPPRPVPPIPEPPTPVPPIPEPPTPVPPTPVPPTPVPPTPVPPIPPRPVPPVVILAPDPSGERVTMPADEILALRERLGGRVTNVPGVGDTRAAALARIGVTTEGQFLTTPSAELAAALDLPEARVTQMKEAASRRRELGLTFR